LCDLDEQYLLMQAKQYDIPTWPL